MTTGLLAAVDYYSTASEQLWSRPIVLRLVQASLAAETEHAQTALSRWLAENPDDLPIRRTYAQVLESRGDGAAAMREYERILEQSSTDAVSLNNLAWQYMEEGRPGAVELAEQAHELVPENGSISDTLGWVLYKDGQLERAEEILRQAASQAPNNAEIKYHLAVVLTESGQNGEAKSLLAEVLASKQQFPSREQAEAIGEAFMKMKFGDSTSRCCRSGACALRGYCSRLAAALRWRPAFLATRRLCKMPKSIRQIIRSGPATVLDIFVWRNPEISTVVPVRPDGKISTPLVEDMVAVGKTPSELARDMEKVLATYIKTPTVNVIVTQFRGAFEEQIRVVGQAASPQTVPYQEGMTILDVMIAVGGLGEFAAGNRAKLVRRVDGDTREYRIRLKDLLDKGEIEHNVVMQPGDVLIIPESFF